jgi:ribokinase
MPRIICAGHVNWDVTLQVDALPAPDGEAQIDQQSQAGGGSASNTAAVMAGLGAESVLLGSVGTDKYSDLASRELVEADVDCSFLQRVEGETTVKYLIVDDAGEVMVLANEGVNEQFDAADLPDSAFDDADHLHLTSQQPETAAELARRGAAAGLPVSFDPGRRIDDRAYEGVIEAVDIVFFNRREASAASDAGLLEPPDTLSVVKSGDGGARVHQGSETVRHPGFDVESVDTAGAGDAFAGGFLVARLASGSLERALEFGNACGAVAVQGVGARASISRAAIDQYCDTSVLD